jgi:hypothetical protein
VNADFDLCIENALVEGNLNGSRIFGGDSEGGSYSELVVSR